ncbi:AAA family ATPase [Rickettsia endosymbiont of Cardiosporidium cionae]|uniref:AAA family ATPase n=1 Tax=Rickettsia endosymbiont of Cardiosporidium cionae TaxID=2777155 RepID=UPI0018936EC4|nr:AAA family ATPase [Rickettsia endosymbiont of Cardiosporidium cionae]KAF8818055.1 peptidyl-arginine deiminase [Rickettsia endosymbiont of Cardiosporidium cionae]
MRTIITINTKGGFRNSTLISNLSIQLIKKDYSVVLIDLDPQKTLEKWWQARDQDNPMLTAVTKNNISLVINNIKKKGTIDYLLIDTPGYMSFNTLNALKLSDLVLVLCNPTAADFRAVGDTIRIVKKEKKEFLFVLNQCIPRNTFVLKAAISLLQFGQVIDVPIYNRVSYANAIYQGTGAGDLDSNAQNEITKIFHAIDIKFNNEVIHDKRKTDFS